MVIFIFGDNVCFGGKCLEVLVSRGEDKRTDIAFVQWDGSNKLALPGKQNVVVLGNEWL